MKSERHLRVAATAVCLYAAWQARDLPAAWLHSPFDHLGALAFAVWAIPLGIGIAGNERPRPVWLCASLAISLAGVVLDVNFFKNAGFATALASFLSSGRRTAGRRLWVAGALSWMPILGWLLDGEGPFFVNGLRLAIALGVSAAFLQGEQRVEAL